MTHLAITLVYCAAILAMLVGIHDVYERRECCPDCGSVDPRKHARDCVWGR